VYRLVNGQRLISHREVNGTYVHDPLSKFGECFVAIIVILIGGFPFTVYYAGFSSNCRIGWWLL
jgi:hypothetical protein